MIPTLKLTFLFVSSICQDFKVFFLVSSSFSFQALLLDRRKQPCQLIGNLINRKERTSI